MEWVENKRKKVVVDSQVKYGTAVEGIQPGKQPVKAQVTNQYYNTGNLYLDSIIRHMLMKWNDHLPSI